MTLILLGVGFVVSVLLLGVGIGVALSRGSHTRVMTATQAERHVEGPGGTVVPFHDPKKRVRFVSDRSA